MKILLDECLPKRLKLLLKDLEVKTVTEMGWRNLKNGVLLQTASNNKFDMLLTIDKNLEFQQNLKLYSVAVIVFDVQKSKIEFLSPLVLKFLEDLKNFEKGKVYYISP